MKNINLTNILGLGGQPVGTESYSFDDFLRDIRTAIIDLSSGLKDVKERLSALENRVKIDNLAFNDKWQIHQRKLTKLERIVSLLQKSNEKGSNGSIIVSVKKPEASSRVHTGNENGSGVETQGDDEDSKYERLDAVKSQKSIQQQLFSIPTLDYQSSFGQGPFSKF